MCQTRRRRHAVRRPEDGPMMQMADRERLSRTDPALTRRRCCVVLTQRPLSVSDGRASTSRPRGSSWNLDQVIAEPRGPHHQTFLDFPNSCTTQAPRGSSGPGSNAGAGVARHLCINVFLSVMMHVRSDARMQTMYSPPRPAGVVNV